MRIVLDSNILVRAAWKADGLASRLLRSVIDGPHRLIVSPFILGEVARVLAYPRIQSRWGLDACRPADPPHQRDARPDRARTGPRGGPSAGSPALAAAVAARARELAQLLGRHRLAVPRARSGGRGGARARIGDPSRRRAARERRGRDRQTRG